jgi:hypothetical protein
MLKVKDDVGIPHFNPLLIKSIFMNPRFDTWLLEGLNKKGKNLLF